MASSTPGNDLIDLRTTREEKRLIAEAAAREQLDITLYYAQRSRRRERSW
jgi:uncharacterized protein (DUF1778 family)